MGEGGLRGEGLRRGMRAGFDQGVGFVLSGDYAGYFDSPPGGGGRVRRG